MLQGGLNLGFRPCGSGEPTEGKGREDKGRVTCLNKLVTFRGFPSKRYFWRGIEEGKAVASQTPMRLFSSPCVRGNVWNCTEEGKRQLSKNEIIVCGWYPVLELDLERPGRLISTLSESKQLQCYVVSQGRRILLTLCQVFKMKSVLILQHNQGLTN